MDDKDRLATVIEAVYEKARAFKNAGQPYPPWIEKQVKAVHLMTVNFDRAMIMLLDGMQDEQEHLETLENENGSAKE